MSIIAIRRTDTGFEIASDSIGVWGNTQVKDAEKLWQISGDLIFGSVGQSSLGTVMKDFISVNDLPENAERGWLRFALQLHLVARKYDLKSEDNSFIIVYKSEAWMLNGLHVARINKYEAVGAGRDYALAALHLGFSALEACEVACDLCTQCERPIKVLSI